MSAELYADLVERAQADFELLLKALGEDGPEYVREYVAWMIDGRPLSQAPNRPTSFPPQVAIVLREIVLDATTAQRIEGRLRRVPA